MSMRFLKVTKRKKHTGPTVPFFILGLVLLLLSSCGTSKKALELTETYDYKIKQLHMERKNSSYDRLMSDYAEMMKSTAQKEAEAFAKDTLAHMYITPCFARCPSYMITVYNSGNVKYEGIKNVSMMGILESKLEPEQKALLAEYMGKLDLIRMPSQYPANVKMEADLSVTKLVLSDGQFKYDITINYGEPQELTNVKLYLEQLITDLSWVQI